MCKILIQCSDCDTCDHLWHESAVKSIGCVIGILVFVKTTDYITFVWILS